MSQNVVTQVFDATSTAGGNLNFGSTTGYPTDGLSALIIAIVVTGATTGAVTSAAVRKDGSTVTLLTNASIAVGTTWAYSIFDGDPTAANPPVGLPPLFLLNITGATTSVARLTVWTRRWQ